MTHVLSIDVETYSSADLPKCGLYKYCEAEDFQVLMLFYKLDDHPVQGYDLTRQQLPEKFVQALTDPAYLKTAWNAAFEITTLSTYVGFQLPVEQWDCTMVRAARAGYPLGLGAAAAAMGVEQQKSGAGMALIRYFSMPCKPSKTNGGRLRNLPSDDPVKWKAFLDYCAQDVRTETSMRDRLVNIPVTPFEQRFWYLDQRINNHGVRVDTQLVDNALSIYEEYSANLKKEASKRTGLDNPNSPAQLIKWLSENGVEVDNLTKKTVKEIIDGIKSGDKAEVRRVLELRQEMSKTSIKKYTAMKHAVGAEDRCRGLFQFYGANRTGRFSGRLIQLQNLPQNNFRHNEEKGIDDLPLARQLVRENQPELLALMFGNVPEVLSQLIRTALIPADGHRFLVADFSAVEARIIAWLADEKWRLETFKNKIDIYEASAAQMFSLVLSSLSYKDPVTGEKVKGPNYHYRQKGKISELALGYGGGVNALITMGALAMGITEEELPEMVQKWRDANPGVTALWKTLNNAAIQAVRQPNVMVPTVKNCKFFVKGDTLHLQLPSGRCLSYIEPRLVENRFGGVSVSYMGNHQKTKQWARIETYGGKFAENLTQAIARDCLAEAMDRLDKAGYVQVVHVHDESVAEMPFGQGSLEEMVAIMGQPISWAPGLETPAAGFETPFYKKD